METRFQGGVQKIPEALMESVSQHAMHLSQIQDWMNCENTKKQISQSQMADLEKKSAELESNVIGEFGKLRGQIQSWERERSAMQEKISAMEGRLMAYEAKGVVQGGGTHEGAPPHPMPPRCPWPPAPPLPAQVLQV